MDETNVLQNLVRVGTVTAVDPGNRTARVLFESSDEMCSDWLAGACGAVRGSRKPGRYHHP